MILRLIPATFPDVFAVTRKQAIQLEDCFLYQLPRGFMAHLGPGAHDLDASLVVHIKAKAHRQIMG